MKTTVDTEDITDYNFRIGERSLTDKSGFYEDGIKKVAYNFLDERESDVSLDPALFSKEYSEFVQSAFQMHQLVFEFGYIDEQIFLQH